MCLLFILNKNSVFCFFYKVVEGLQNLQKISTHGILDSLKIHINIC